MLYSILSQRACCNAFHLFSLWLFREPRYSSITIMSPPVQSLCITQLLLDSALLHLMTPPTASLAISINYFLSSQQTCIHCLFTSLFLVCVDNIIICGFSVLL